MRIQTTGDLMPTVILTKTIIIFYYRQIHLKLIQINFTSSNVKWKKDWLCLNEYEVVTVLKH